jgi:hypothetical protein
MTAVTTLPTWAVYAVGFGTPGSAFVGVIVGHVLTRRGTRELEKRSKREETMRNLRWAAELAVSEDDRAAQLGVAQLNALAESDLLDDSQQLFVDAALDSVLQVPLEEIEEAGEDARVIQLVGPFEEGITEGARSVLSSTEGTPEGEDGEDG